jgi:signal transduction histidine kinase
MSRRWTLWAFAAAIVLPAVALAALGVRAIRAEEGLRRAEERERGATFAGLAARDVDADAEAWLSEALSGAPALPSEPAPVPDLALQLALERPELAAALADAERAELALREPAASAYAALAAATEHASAKARLLAREARCRVRAGETERARRLYEALAGGDTPAESMLPMSVASRLALLDLGGDRDALARELTALAGTLDPDSALFVLERAGAVNDRARMAVRAAAWARTRRVDVDHAWFPGGWVAAVRGGRVVLLQAGLPGDSVRRRIEETASVAGLNVRFATEPGGDHHAPALDGTLWVIATSALPPGAGAGTRIALFGGLVALLVASMLAGLAMTLRAVRRELRLAQLKSDFASTVSHELRTPLTAVRLHAELLSRDDERAVILKEEAERLSRLVERILDFARLERGEQVLSFDVCDLRDVVGDAVRRFRPARADFEVRWTSPDTPVRAAADAAALERALHNLLDNAVKYAGEGREAVVELATEGAYARIAVSDRGAGIDPRDVPALFEKFHRGRSPATLQVPGTGLGLALVRQVAEAHRGRARLEVPPGGGSRFVIEIPLWRGS